MPTSKFSGGWRRSTFECSAHLELNLRIGMQLAEHGVEGHGRNGDRVANRHEPALQVQPLGLLRYSQPEKLFR